MMALLGVGLPFLPNGGQLLVDAYPQPETAKNIKRSRLGLWQYTEFLVVRLPPLDQRDLWEAFQRVLQVSDVPCLDPTIRQDLLDLAHETITRPRNGFLYRPAFWPGTDLLADGVATELERLLGTELDSDHDGFLLRLGCCVYRLFEQMITDLGSQSGVIRGQLHESRISRDPVAAELTCYNTFLSQIESTGTHA